jgi:hypothetical protein
MHRETNGGVPGVIFSHGNYWKELRRFLLRNLRDFGFGKTSMEDLFQVGTWNIWGRCYDHNFLRFLTIFGETIGVFLENQCYDQDFA